MKAKKHLGQHFLIDTTVVNEILAAINTHCPLSQPILEIGPGPGVLTRPLAAKYDRFKAVEYDRDMIAHLSQSLDPELLINQDFLALDLAPLFDGEAFNLVGNFPYNISSQIVFKMLDHKERIPTMIGMFQREVAKRICADPGTKANGIITLLTQAHYSAEILMEIPPGAFDPPPKVHSSVIRLSRREDDLPDYDEKLFKTIIKTSFQQRRKKLRNTLKSFIQDEGNPILQERPEHLGVKDFINIAQLIKAQR